MLWIFGGMTSINPITYTTVAEYFDEDAQEWVQHAEAMPYSAIQMRMIAISETEALMVGGWTFNDLALKHVYKFDGGKNRNWQK